MSPCLCAAAGGGGLRGAAGGCALARLEQQHVAHPCTCATGVQSMRVKTESPPLNAAYARHRQTWGYTPSMPLVVSRSPSCTSALLCMKRSSMPPPSPSPGCHRPRCVRPSGVEHRNGLVAIHQQSDLADRTAAPVSPAPAHHARRAPGAPSRTPASKPLSTTTRRVYGSAAS